MTHATTVPFHAVSTATAENRTGGTGIGKAFRSVYEALIRAQQARANVRVRPYLAAQSSETLERLGFSEAEIEDIRSTPSARALPFI